MEAILGTLATTLAPVAVTLLTTLLSMGMVYLNRWLKAKAGTEAAAAVSEVTGAVVAETCLLAKKFKAAAGDGKLTEPEKEELKRMALESVKRQVPKAMGKAAGRAVGGLELFIAGKIEQAVRAEKK